MVALATDYDCWREGEGVEHVTVAQVVETMTRNVEVAQKIVKACTKYIAAHQGSRGPEETALKDAIMTKVECIPNKLYHELAPLIAGYLPPRKEEIPVLGILGFTAIALTALYVFHRNGGGSS